MSKIIHPSEVEYLLNNGNITTAQAINHKETWTNLNTTERQEETQSIIVESIITTVRLQRSIKRWVTFFGIIYILTILGVLIVFIN